MRVFENKLTEIKEATDRNGGFKILTYVDLVKACTDRIPQGGLVTSEQKKRLDVQCLIHDKLKAGDKVEIEEHIYETIKSCVVNFPWNAQHRDLCDFEDYVVAIEEKKK